MLGERRFISLSLPAPGAGARMLADPRPQTWREGRSPALAPLPLLMGAEGRAGEDGWRAVPPGPRFITDTKPRRRPRLIRKSAGAAAGPPGAPRASLPRAPGSVRARRFFARSLPLARPPPLELPAVPSVSGSHRATHSACARAASSRTPGAAPQGGRWWRRGGDRRPPLRRPGRAGRAEQQTWRGSWRRGAEGVLGTRGACGIASPAQHCPSFPLLVSPPTAGGRGRGADAGAVPALLRAGCAPPDLEPEPAPQTPQPPPEGGRGLPSVCCSQSSPAQAAWP